ncbi:hypothetical protein MKX08_008623 [Trichoderma sp. CBMAI-0020]|nr:hypothetical protein MKX08_008623 [Trichoderma sp. CBMAI-0020]
MAHAPIYEAKPAPALLHRGRPCFSSGSSLSGYASAATGSPGQDVNDPEAGRQHSQSKWPGQGSSPGTHKERGLAAPDFLGEVFSALVPAALPLSALICLSAVASRSSGAQQQRDLDPPPIHAMGGSLDRMEAIDRLGATAAQRCEHARRPRCTACERAAVQSAGRGHASPKEEQNEAHNLDVGRTVASGVKKLLRYSALASQYWLCTLPTHTLDTPQNLPQPPSLHAGPSPTWPSQTITFKGNHLACALSFFGLRYVVAAAVASTLPPTILPPDREKNLPSRTVSALTPVVCGDSRSYWQRSAVQSLPDS